MLGSIIDSVADYFAKDEGGSVTLLSQKIKKAYGTAFDINGLFKVEFLNLNNALGKSFLDSASLNSTSFGGSVTGNVDGEMNAILSSAAGKVNSSLKSMANSIKSSFSKKNEQTSGQGGGIGEKASTGNNTTTKSDKLVESAKDLMGLHVNPVVGIDHFDMFVKSVSVNEISFSDLREWIGQGWVNSIGRHELQQIQITLRDSNGGALYSRFFGLLAILKDCYPEDQLWTIKIRKRMLQESRNYINPAVQNEANKAGNLVVDTKHAVLRSLGSLELDQDNPEFSTFTIVFDIDPFPNNI